MLNYLILLSGILTVGLGFFVLFVKERKPIHVTFFFMSLLFGFWILLNFWLQSAPNDSIFRAIFSNSVLLPIAVFFWVGYLKSNEIDDKYFIFLGFLSAVAFFLIGMIWDSNLIIDKFLNPSNVVLGKYFLIYAIYMILSLAGILIMVVSAYIKSQDQNRQQLKYVVIGFATFLITATLFGVVLPAIGYDKLANFDSPSSIFFLIFSSIAILRYRFFNIEVAGSIFLSLALWFVLIAKTLVDRGTTSFGSDIIVLFFSIALGVLLIRSSLSEIKRRVELQKLTEDLNRANRKLQQVDALKTEFISMASHELLTPISAINGYLSMIFDEKLVKIEDEKAVKYLDQVYGSSKRLAKLVAELLNVSRIEQGRLLIEKTDLELKELAENVVAELKFKGEENKQELKTNFDSSEKIISYADSDKVKEILINLCSNSIKYSPNGSKIEIGIKKFRTDEVEKEYNEMEKIKGENEEVPDSSLQNAINENLRQMVGGEQIVVFVKDNGLGLSDDDLSHLFKKFSRVGDYTTQKVQGTGLGLYLSKALTEMQHGRIWAKSDGRGKGSTFFFSLPEISQKAAVEKLDGLVKTAADAKPLAKSDKNY